MQKLKICPCGYTIEVTKMESTMPKKANGAVKLDSFLERINRLEEEKHATVQDIKAVYHEAQAAGFSKEALKEIMAEMRKDNSPELAAKRITVARYKKELAAMEGTPLGDWAAASIKAEATFRKRGALPITPEDDNNGDGEPTAAKKRSTNRRHAQKSEGDGDDERRREVDA